jgi:release factor glutamine methyltransferase
MTAGSADASGPRAAGREAGAATVEALVRAGGLPDNEAGILLAHALGVDRAWLIAHHADVIDGAQAERYAALCGRRHAGEPIAYLTGRREFYGLDFHVSDAVLIPRPETELLVDLALERLPREGAARVLDLGTGSGCVALAIAVNRKHVQVTAGDASAAALEIARGNGAALGAEVNWILSDWYEALGGERFDLVVANPPYVAANDPHLAMGDLRFEPRLALTPASTGGGHGGAGLAAIDAIVAGAREHLFAGGWLLFEHGYDQAPACRERLQHAGYGSVQSWRDLAGIERVSGGTYPE